MTDRLVIQESPVLPAHEQHVEIVERKGKGHPDAICDAVAERISIELSRAYVRAFGWILHHNIDKALLIAGQVECWLGGGRMLEPMRLIIGDRAALGVGGKTLPVAEIAEAAARDWFKQSLRHIDPDRHVRYQIELKPTSQELGTIFEAPRGLLVANDTSAAVGYAPSTPTERLVVDVEQFLNGPLCKAEFPETGEDVKVMAVRTGNQLALTLAIPFLAGAIPTEDAYFRQKARIVRAIHRYVQGQPHGCKKVRLVVNALDRRGKGLDGMYLTLLGTSAEQGDSGQVGRGNRVSGFIATNRPNSGEAAAGKNPVSHVGKIYNVLAHDLATRIHRQVPGVQEATVQLCSRIGQRIDRPAAASVQVSLKRRVPLSRVERPIRRIFDESLKNLGTFCDGLAKGKYQVS